MWTRAIVLALVLCVSPSARAEDARVLVVVETPHGARVGAAIRRGLAVQAGAQVLLAETGDAPDIVLTVTARDARSVTVRYWDRRGHTDVLSVPLPNPSARIEDIASTLGAILLQRNHPSAQRGEEVASVAWDGAFTTFASAAQPPNRRTFPLSLSDF